MIYLDVTGACLLPLQSGIPRTTRGLWQLLQSSEREVTPLCWQPFRAAYTELTPRGRQLLEDPLRDSSSSRVPRDSTWPLLWASFQDLRFGAKSIPLAQVMKEDDTLFLTSLFPDNRLGYLLRLAAVPGYKVAMFHDAIPLHDANVPKWERSRHVKLLNVLSGINLVIAVSEAARRDLEALWRENGMVPTSTVALPWPVPFTSKRPAYAEPAGAKRVLYVSRLKQMKNHSTLFAACEKLWNEGLAFELELIGCEDEASESRAIRREIDSLQARGRAISWRAHVSEEELHLAYQRARLTVFPSLMEGFGLPVLESLWHGRGVICSGEGAVGELAGKGGGCVMVDVRDGHALARAMRELLENDSRCQALSREAHARPVRTWDDYARELMPLLVPR